MLETVKRFFQDRRGAGNPIEFALVLPVFLTVLLGAYQIWEIISIKESLDRGVVQAAEYWSTCLRQPLVNSAIYEETAAGIIHLELSHSPAFAYKAEKSLRPIKPRIVYYRYDVEDGRRLGVIDHPGQLTAFETFVIEARVEIPWGIELPFFPPYNLTLRTSHLAFTEKPYEWPRLLATPASASEGQEQRNAP